MDLIGERASLVKSNTEMSVKDDAYSMLFRALHEPSAEKMNISNDDQGYAVQAVLVSFAMQSMLIIIIYGVIFDWDKSGPYNVNMPKDCIVYLCRILSIFLMHLQIEPFYNLGLDMMKFSKNHPSEFRSFGTAFLVGLFQYLSTCGVELCGVYYLCTINTVIDIVAKQVAIFFLIRVADFYGKALGKTSKLASKKDANEMKVDSYREIAD